MVNPATDLSKDETEMGAVNKVVEVFSNEHKKVQYALGERAVRVDGRDLPNTIIIPKK